MSDRVNATPMGRAFSCGFSGKYRMLDEDPYWGETPGSEKCGATTATVKCRIR